MNISIRQLSNYEIAFLNIAREGDFIVGASCFIETELASSKDINRELFLRCLDYLQKRHPFLRSNLHLDILNNKAFLKINNESNVLNVFEWKEINPKGNKRDEIIRSIESINTKKLSYDEQSLLWTYNVIRYEEEDKLKLVITFVIPAFISDGINIVTLLLESLNILNSLLTYSECEEMRVQLQVLPDLHELCQKNDFEPFIQKSKQKLNEIPNKFLLDEKFKYKDQHGLKIHLLKVNSNVTERLISKAKSKNIKLTSLLASSALYALNQLYKESDLKFPQNFSLSIPANLRLRYKTPLNDFSGMGFHMCGVFVSIDKDSTLFNDIFEDSEIINEILGKKTNIEDGSIFARSHSDKILNGIRLGQELSHANVITDLIVSNIGTSVYNNSSIIDGPLKLNEVYFGDSITTKPNVSSSIILSILFWAGELMIRLSINKGSLNSEFSDKLVKNFEDILVNTAS